MAKRMREFAARSALTIAVSAMVVGASPIAPAEGHTLAQSDVAHYLTRLVGIRPNVRGLTATVDPRGEWVEVSNATATTLVILGYAGEPYLRISAAGVQENALSASAQLNQAVVGELSPAGFTHSVPPAWRPVSAGRTARWHDLRLHWGSTQRPAGVSAHPDRAQLIARWTVRMRLGATAVRIAGTLSWLPIRRPPAVARFTLALDVVLVSVGTVSLIALWVRRRHRRVEG